MSVLNNFSHWIGGSEKEPKLVFLHGLMGSWVNWRKILGAFEENFHILAYDQRGHGRSFHPSKGYEPKDYAQDLKDILEALQWDKPISLVGHSLGARNALSFANLFPQKLKKLVIEDYSIHPGWETGKWIVKGLSLIPTPFESRETAKLYFQEKFSEHIKEFDGNPTRLSLFFQSNLRANKKNQWDWRFSKKGMIESLEKGRLQPQTDNWKNLTVPTCLIRGENSTHLLPSDFQKMLSLQPLAQGYEVKGASHWVHHDAPKIFIKILKDFLGSFDLETENH